MRLSDKPAHAVRAPELRRPAQASPLALRPTDARPANSMPSGIGWGSQSPIRR